MSELSEYLDRQMKQRGWSLRDAEREIGVSRSAIDNLLKEKSEYPDVGTMVKIAQAFHLPLWRVLQMYGLDMGLSNESTLTQAQHLTALLDAMPPFRPIVDHLLNIRPDDLEGILIYLEGLRAVRERQKTHQTGEP